LAVRRAGVLAPPRRAQPIDVRPETSLAGARRAALREGLEHMLANFPGAAADRDPEYLHQLRVGMRRLRAALRVFEETLRMVDVRALRRMLRELGRAAGPARDWDVHARRLPSRLRPAAERRRRSAYAALRRVLRAPQLWPPPRGIVSAEVALPLFARVALEKAEREVRKRGDRLDWTRAGKRHELRIRLRRLRYAAEFLRGAFPESDAEPLIASLKRLQELLGALNDLEVARRLQSELTGEKPRRSVRTARLLEALPAAWDSFVAAPRFWR
jgi:CHAD domain-containing protein